MISDCSDLTAAVVEGVGSIGTEVAQLAKSSWEGVIPSLARTASCEIEGRRFSKLVERDFEDKL